MNTKKYNINDFFVGEVYLLQKFGNLLEGPKICKEDILNNLKIESLLNGGAIRMQHIPSYIDYECFLSIFYKNKDEYLSLHDNVSYSLNGEDCCKNLIPLSELLPKIAFNIPDCISINQAHKYFNFLFINRNKQLHDKQKYNLDDFYVGKLNLYTGYSTSISIFDKKQHSNISHIYRLYNSDADISSCSGFYLSNKNKTSFEYQIHNYISFNCLFKKIRDGKIYNIHNFQYYNNYVLSKEHSRNFPIGESYCDFMFSFRKYLESKNLDYQSDTITIPNALKLYKKSR